MALFVKLLARHKFLLLIILIATFFRFYDYQNRWVLNQDQARDAIISLYSIRNLKLPLLGPYSSAGPYNFGAMYYFLTIFSSLLYPFVSGPWFAFTLLSIFSVFLFYKIGQSLLDKNLGLICALLTAFSPSLILNSTDMLNTVAVLFAVSLNFYFLVSQIKKPKNLYLNLIGFTVGLANNFHFQSLGFGSILIAFLIFNFKNIKQLFFQILLMAIGFFISFLPNLIFDLFNNFVWSKSVLAYYFGGGGDKFYYPVRWLTDIRDFWPGLWGETITGFSLSGYILIGIYILFFIKSKPKNVKKFNLILILSLAVQVLLLRYYKGVRSREYLITFHPYFILLSALCLNSFTKNKLLKTLTIITFLTLALITNIKIINQKSQAQEIINIKKQINQNNVDIYSLNGDRQITLPLFYLFYQQNRINSKNGYKIATCRPNEKINCPDDSYLIASSSNYNIYSINHLSDQDLESYYQFTPQRIYNSLYINYPNAKTF